MRERRGEGAGVRRGGAKREARATTRAQVLVAREHVNFAEGSVQSVKVDPSRIPKDPVSGLDHHWALNVFLCSYSEPVLVLNGSIDFDEILLTYFEG